jgi:stage III sporulation protein AG
MKMSLDTKRLRSLGGAVGKYKYILFVILAGILLMLLPGRSDRESETSDAQAGSAADFTEPFNLQQLEEEMAQTLSQVEGAGEVEVILTLEASTEQVLARDSETSRENDGDKVTVDSSSEAVVVSRAAIRTRWW